MRKLIYLIVVSLFILSVGDINAKASFNLLGCNYATVNITYESVDTQNNPITLSAVLYYPTSSGTNVNNIKTCNYIFLNNHATITDNASSPSGGQSAMGQLYWMTTDNALVVNPDYLGFGGTRDKVHPYMAMTLTARNVVDCMKAAIADAKQRNKLANDYYTINCGYSQGGGVTMAVARYLETEADEATQRLVNLRGSICGAGCYNQSQILADYEGRSSITYPIYLPYLIQGMFEVYGEGCLHGLTLEDCFTQTFLDSQILDKLNAKGTDVDALNSELISYMGGSCTFYDIVNADFRDHNSELYRRLYKAICKNDLITDDWTPLHPIVFYHYSGDEVVPYAGTELAMSKWGDTGMVTLKRGEDITNYGAWQLAFLKYPNLKQNHRDYGTCFYLLVFDGQLDPTPATDGFISTQARTGVDRNEIDVNLKEGQWSLVSFPSEVDGYYFGPNAERYEVSKTEKEGFFTMSLKAMEDDQDFVAGKDYLVCPTADVSKIVSVTAGVMTPVKANIDPLITNKLAIETSLANVGTSNYATLYSLFAVNIPEGVKAYTAHLKDNRMQMTELAEGVIPAKTGVVLKGSAEGQTLLTYNTEGEHTASSDLTGVVMDTPKTGDVLTLGTNSNNTLGFFRYKGETLAAGKAFYPIPENQEVHGYKMMFDTEDAIFTPTATGNMEHYYDLQGRKLKQAPQSGLYIVRKNDGSAVKTAAK